MSDAARPGVLDAAGILAGHPDGVVVADAEGTVVFCNPRAARLLGVPADGLVGRNVVEALPLLDDTGHSWWGRIDPWHGPRLRTGHRERLLLLPGRGNVLVTMSYLRPTPQGEVESVVVALRDTQGRRRAERETGELLSMVAHELRAPLASVKGFSTTLLRRWDRFNDEQKRLMLETIEADADRLARLIHELLDVSRLDARRLRLERAHVDVGELVMRSVDRMVASGLDPSRFEVTMPDPAPVLFADGDRLDQVVANLVENAVRHGSGVVRIVVSEHAESSSLRIAVSDEGEGIPRNRWPLIFGKFWHGTRRGSTGLGLYLARGLVEAHGGSLTVDDAPTGGALFTVGLPRHSA